MAAKPEVEEFLRKLNHPLADVIAQLRSIIRNAEPELTEHIKWNAPSFCKNEVDRITFNFPPKRNEVLLVFHRGVAKKEVPVSRFIEDESGLLQWKSNDRAIARFLSLSQVDDQKATLMKIIELWLSSD